MSLWDPPAKDSLGGAALREWKIPAKARHSVQPSPLDLPFDPDKQGRGRLAPYLKLLQKMLESDPRSKIKDFYDALSAQGYTGSYDSVKKRIQALRRNMGRQAGKLFASADQPQVQVELTRIVLKGGERDARAFLFTMVLGHSGGFYAELIETCDMARFLQCHLNAFEFFGGVPKQVYYDPRENPALRRLVGGYPFHLPVVHCGLHYGYSVEATPMFAPWMKGRLKRPGKVLRKFFFSGYRQTSLESANQDLRDWMARDGKEQSAADSGRPRQDGLGQLPRAEFNFRNRQQLLRLRG